MISPTCFRWPARIGFVSFLAIAVHTAVLSVPVSAGDAKQAADRHVCLMQEAGRKASQIKWKPSLLEGGYMFQDAKRFEAYVRRAEIVAVGILTKWEGNKGQVRLESIIRGTLKDASKDAAIPIHGTGGIVRPKAGDKVLLLLTSRDGKLRLHSFCAASGMYGYSRDLEKVLSGIVRSDDHSNRKP